MKNDLFEYIVGCVVGFTSLITLKDFTLSVIFAFFSGMFAWLGKKIIQYFWFKYIKKPPDYTKPDG